MSETVAQPRSWVYVTARSVVRVVCSTFHHVTVVGTENVPEDGPFLVVATHRSHLDPPVLSLITKRHLRFLAKRELFAKRPSGVFLGSLGAVPVSRAKVDLAAFRSCVRILRNGEGLVVFPEGTRQSGAIIGELERGASLLAVKANAPLVPVAVVGTEDALGKGAKRMRRSTFRIVIGDALDPDTSLDTLHQTLGDLYGAAAKLS